MRGVQTINHAQFTDDTILLGSASTQITWRFRTSLDLFLKVSGSKLNSQKSWIYGWNCSPAILSEIAQILGIKVNIDWTSFLHLGITISKRSSNSQSWNFIIQKIKKKLQAWGARWLNLAGKSTLIKSILSSYPIFLFTIFLAPKSIQNDISKELRKFMWQGGKTLGKTFN